MPVLVLIFDTGTGLKTQEYWSKCIAAFSATPTTDFSETFTPYRFLEARIKVSKGTKSKFVLWEPSQVFFSNDTGSTCVVSGLGLHSQVHFHDTKFRMFMKVQRLWKHKHNWQSLGVSQFRIFSSKSWSCKYFDSLPPPFFYDKRIPKHQRPIALLPM